MHVKKHFATNKYHIFSAHYSSLSFNLVFLLPLRQAIFLVSQVNFSIYQAELSTPSFRQKFPTNNSALLANIGANHVN